MHALKTFGTVGSKGKSRRDDFNRTRYVEYTSYDRETPNRTVECRTCSCVMHKTFTFTVRHLENASSKE